MNVVILRGTLSSDPVSRDLASGSVLVSLELTTTVDEASVSVPVAWFDPAKEVTFAAGDVLVVTGRYVAPTAAKVARAEQRSSPPRSCQQGALRGDSGRITWAAAAA